MGGGLEPEPLIRPTQALIEITGGAPEMLDGRLSITEDGRLQHNGAHRGLMDWWGEREGWGEEPGLMVLAMS